EAPRPDRPARGAPSGRIRPLRDRRRFRPRLRPGRGRSAPLPRARGPDASSRHPLMRVLAIDTSTWWGGAALVERSADGSILVAAECALHVEDSHAARLLPVIEALLGLAGWAKTDPAAYAATRGPGSFTGIRVGLGLLEGLALATGRRCLGIPTLQAMAE